MSADLLAIATAIFLFAGIIKGTVGIGLPTAAIGMLSQIIDPRTAIALVVGPLLATNVWQVLRAGRFPQTLQKYAPFIIALMLVLGSTTFALPYVPTDGLVIVLGIVVVIFAVASLISAPPQLPDRFDRLGQIVAGIAAGIIGGLTAIWGPPIVIYLLARRTEKDEFVRALGTLLCLGGVPLVLGFWRNGMLQPGIALISVFMILPSLAGFGIGEQLRKRLHAGRFRNAVLIMFLLMGLNLIRRAVF